MNKLEVLDTESGEIIGEYLPSFKKEKMPHTEFLLFFAKNLSTLIKSKPSNKDIIISRILSKMDGNNHVYLFQDFREPLAKELNCNPSYVSKVISELLQKEILFRLHKGVYMVNPYIYGKGNLDNIKNVRWNFEAIIENDEVEIDYEIKEEG